MPSENHGCLCEQRLDCSKTPKLNKHIRARDEPSRNALVYGMQLLVRHSLQERAEDGHVPSQRPGLLEPAPSQTVTTAPFHNPEQGRSDRERHSEPRCSQHPWPKTGRDARLLQRTVDAPHEQLIHDCDCHRSSNDQERRRLPIVVSMTSKFLLLAYR